MATIKSFTDISQGKILSKILPIESADMYWWFSGKRYYIEAMDDDDFNEEEGHIRAWSLAALLGRLPFPVLYMEMVAGMILWCCECHFIETDEVVKIEHYDNPVDACVAMVEKLHELKML